MKGLPILSSLLWAAQTDTPLPPPGLLLTDVQGPTEAFQVQGKDCAPGLLGDNLWRLRARAAWHVGFYSKYRGHGLSLIGPDMYGESPEVIKRFLLK